jgi:uncharacterized protein DUF2878
MVGQPLSVRTSRPIALAVHRYPVAIALNIALFQLGWIVCVLAAARGLPWIGALAALAIVAWHVARAGSPGRELALIAAAASLGAVFDWMVGLWAIFATTLNVSLRWLRARPWLAAALGFLGGPAAYYSGARLGAMEFITAGAALAGIALGWAIATPLLLGVARRLDDNPA